MEHRLKPAVALCAVVMFAALAATAGRAESNGQNAPAKDGSGSTTTAADTGHKDSGASDKGNGPGSGPSDHNAAPGGQTAGPNAGPNSGPSPHVTGPGPDGGHKGANVGQGTASVSGTGPGPKGGTGDHIDLVSHDDGYASLRRRANRQSLIANAANKKTTIKSTNLAVRPQGLPANTSGGVVRNAVGALAPSGPTTPHPDAGHRPPGFVPSGNSGSSGTAGPPGPPGPPGPNLHVSPHVNTVIHATVGTGINGNNFGHLASGPGTVGGAARATTGVNGTSLRPRF